MVEGMGRPFGFGSKQRPQRSIRSVRRGWSGGVELAKGEQDGEGWGRLDVGVVSRLIEGARGISGSCAPSPPSPSSPSSDSLRPPPSSQTRHVVVFGPAGSKGA